MATARGWVSPSVLPGFGLTLGFAGMFLAVGRARADGGARHEGREPAAGGVLANRPPSRVRSRRTGSAFGASLVAATVNAVFGFVVAWTLVRYRFPGRRIVDALIDLPFALPTAVSGIALATVFAAAGMDRLVARAARYQGCLHVDRRRDRAHVDRRAIRRPLGAARARGGGRDLRGGGRVSRRGALDGLLPRDPADRVAVARDRLHARARAFGSASTDR